MNQPRVPTWRDNPEFVNNPTIQALAQECRWTISSMQPIPTANLKTGKPYTLPAKSPLDVRELVRAPNFRGAFEISEQCLMTLDELNHHFPTATNNAFYLSAQIDEVVVLDIEPACPAEVRDQLLALPALYRERSMSGDGYHMVMPLPANFGKFSFATSKTKLQEEHRWYEILIDHWVTFTRDVVPDPVASLGEPSRTWEQVYADLAAKAVETVRNDLHVEEEMPDFPRFDFIMKIMLQLPYTKTVADFHGDRSRWEYGAMGHMYNKLSTLLMADLLVDERDWSDSDRVWLLYQAAVRFLPARDKHHEKRSGMPYLRYVATTMVAQRSHPDGQPDQGG